MSAREPSMPEAEVKDWLQQNLPKWKLEEGWIRRTYRTSSWKGQSVPRRRRNARTTLAIAPTTRQRKRARPTMPRRTSARLNQ